MTGQWHLYDEERAELTRLDQHIRTVADVIRGDLRDAASAHPRVQVAGLLCQVQAMWNEDASDRITNVVQIL
ncbi:hypothetical protein GCM10010530_74070 [Kribbella aluminosa]